MGERYEVREHDVLIIGAGGAGLRAAIAAAERGLSVGIVTKSLLGKAHTVMAEGGIAAAVGNVDPDDSWRQHFIDTLNSGKFLNNWRMAETFTKEAPRGSSSSSSGERSSTGRRRAGSPSAPSAGTRTAGSATSATGRGWR